ncbi:hypothetical protein MPTK1_4g08990 [Marchantia polymorpha subsp. ruderalis]|uniref:Uncharacterized protein n=2 Tax=Marchantia polymorpha TaxID=3197 RepID=A0AAF6B7Y0_MARPO|nr:hypothetical protein MARPO_0112s0001 [Marchantia polymorpha]BBN08114.1 hypothetical protein Mp_4g08990 [Marchantia polymorpha subsp. ruderalis]|eukprot:PTQ31340.1 hypothetical protein MARPO_0112s0001 [Marchantia polymorpha]
MRFMPLLDGRDRSCNLERAIVLIPIRTKRTEDRVDVIFIQLETLLKIYLSPLLDARYFGSVSHILDLDILVITRPRNLHLSLRKVIYIMYTSLEYVEANGRVRYRRFLTRTLEIYAGLTVASVGLHLFTGRFMKLLSPMRKKTSRLRSVQICGFSNGLLSRPESSRILAQRSDFGKNYIISLFANLQEAWEGEARVTREIVWCDH